MSDTKRLVKPLDIDRVLTLSISDRAYIAGFFDGEGSIGLYTKKFGFALKLSFTQRKPETLLWLHDIFGGALITIHRDDRNTGYYELRFEKREHIATILRILIPYLREKKTQAEIAQSFINDAVDMTQTEKLNVVELLRSDKRT